jgi:hypothetical protein
MQRAAQEKNVGTSANRKRVVIVAGCVAAVMLGGVGIKVALDRRVPPPDADPARVARYMASPEFAALPDAQKRPYLQAFQRPGVERAMTPEQHNQVVANVVARSGNSPIHDYFSLPPGKERERFLDRVIDNQMKIQSGSPRVSPGSTPPDGAKLAGPAVGDSMPPVQRAQMDQFMQELHDRRAARGVPDNGTVLFTR